MAKDKKKKGGEPTPEELEALKPSGPPRLRKKFEDEVRPKIAEKFQGIYLFLLNKWYFDELYDKIFVRPAFLIGRGLWKGGDGALIDGYGPDGVSNAVRVMARRVSALQTGYLYHYAFAMLIGIAALVSWYMFTQGS